MTDSWPVSTVVQLQQEGILLVEDGNHGEYRPRPDEFVDTGVAFIRAADMDDGRILFGSASKINDRARNRITKGIGAPGDVLLSHKGTVGKVALVPEDAPPFVCSPQTTFWRSRDLAQLDRKYLYAFLRSPEFHAQLATRAGETDMAPYVSLLRSLFRPDVYRIGHRTDEPEKKTLMVFWPLGTGFGEPDDLHYRGGRINHCTNRIRTDLSYLHLFGSSTVAIGGHCVSMNCAWS